jgi:two-component system sensor histidine kinase KdpD
MTRLESGGIRVRREWVPLEELIGAALTRLDSKLANREVVTRLPADSPLLSVDPVLFQQVFVNLLENAAKHAPADSPIEIRAEVADEAVVVDVLDRGPGIPAGAEEKVFEKFYRGPHVSAGGVGLGLAICRGIIDAHGGTIRAQNRAGGGALFRIELPVVGQAPEVPLPDAPPSAPSEEAP